MLVGIIQSCHSNSGLIISNLLCIHSSSVEPIISKQIALTFIGLED